MSGHRCRRQSRARSFQHRAFRWCRTTSPSGFRRALSRDRLRPGADGTGQASRRTICRKEHVDLMIDATRRAGELSSAPALFRKNHRSIAGGADSDHPDDRNRSEAGRHPVHAAMKRTAASPPSDTIGATELLAVLQRHQTSGDADRHARSAKRDASRTRPPALPIFGRMAFSDDLRPVLNVARDNVQAMPFGIHSAAHLSLLPGGQPALRRADGKRLIDQLRTAALFTIAPDEEVTYGEATRDPARRVRQVERRPG